MIGVAAKPGAAPDPVRAFALGSSEPTGVGRAGELGRSASGVLATMEKLGAVSGQTVVIGEAGPICGRWRNRI
jgi:hypothetical protein